MPLPALTESWGELLSLAEAESICPLSVSVVLTWELSTGDLAPEIVDRAGLDGMRGVEVEEAGLTGSGAWVGIEDVEEIAGERVGLLRKAAEVVMFELEGLGLGAET